MIANKLLQVTSQSTAAELYNIALEFPKNYAAPKTKQGWRQIDHTFRVIATLYNTQKEGFDQELIKQRIKIKLAYAVGVIQQNNTDFATLNILQCFYSALKHFFEQNIDVKKIIVLFEMLKCEMAFQYEKPNK